MREFGADGKWNGMTQDEVRAAEALTAQMTGWLYNLTCKDDVVRLGAEEKLAAATATFKGFTEPQQQHFFKKFRFNPADLPTALIVLVAFGLARMPETD